MYQYVLPALADASSDRMRLTRRELEVLELVAQGLTNRQIAEQCWISPNTVTVHVGSILAKLGVPTRTKAAITALQLGILPPA